MDSPMALLKFIAPQIPGLSYAAVQHTFGLTNTSKQWDLRTELTVKVLKDMMSNGGGSKKVPRISKVQAGTLRDSGVKGKMWIAPAVLPKPPSEDEAGGQGMRDVVFKAIDDMAPNKEAIKYTKPELEDIKVEWTGYRPDAGKNDPLPSDNAEENYKSLMRESWRTSETTILYFHGGAYYLCDPVTHRALTSRLAKESHGRVCSVRYRLAPQTAFPGQLLDALQSYLSLLYPPANSLHEAVPADKIVFAGDSAGGNLAFALLQLLLQLHRSNPAPTIRFHGRDVLVPLPAGCSANSGWFDIARAMPSITSNSKYDYLPPPNHDDAVSSFPTEPGVWPADPPRGDLFCDLSLLDHPLVSPVLAQDWSGSGPLWFCTGQEMLTDEDCVVAKTAAKQDVIVQFEQYEAMPHCFAMLIPHLATSERLMKSWGEWARKATEEKESLKTNGVFVPVRKGGEIKLDVKEIEAPTYEDVVRLVREAKEKRLLGFEKEGKMMPKPAL
ncbi:Acetyl-hydrolase [Pseudocercospora fuligena]|uniref:Acetyl-hydrolase n=1 Tax=Pseudocercospora fuligena TaxID=685502 RepID=A0A8H6VP94_9PEZI|nr:Acetyl-hydrolase [Pseudocercospora fuligena]